MSSYAIALPNLPLVLSSSRLILDSGETASRALRAAEAALDDLREALVPPAPPASR